MCRGRPDGEPDGGPLVGLGGGIPAEQLAGSLEAPKRGLVSHKVPPMTS